MTTSQPATAQPSSCSTARWPLERIVPLLAGFVVSTSVAAGIVFSPVWLTFAALAGVSLLMFATLGWCPATLVLEAFGVRRAIPRIRAGNENATRNMGET